jgi:uncharacterized protein YacL
MLKLIKDFYIWSFETNSSLVFFFILIAMLIDTLLFIGLVIAFMSWTPLMPTPISIRITLVLILWHLISTLGYYIHLKQKE